MIDQQLIHYERIAEAIKYIEKNFKQQPSLDEIAAAVHLQNRLELVQKNFTVYSFGICEISFLGSSQDRAFMINEYKQ